MPPLLMPLACCRGGGTHTDGQALNALDKAAGAIDPEILAMTDEARQCDGLTAAAVGVHI